MSPFFNVMVRSLPVPPPVVCVAVFGSNGGRFGAEANYDTFTQWQWLTVRDEPKSFGPTY